MKIHLRDGLPFVTVTLIQQGRQLTLQHVLLDTGSAGSFFSADELLKINVRLELNDPLRRVRGVGGAEFVFIKSIESLAVGKLRVDHLAVEVGALNYGFAIEGILGMDFLLQAKAKINLAKLTLT